MINEGRADTDGPAKPVRLSTNFYATRTTVRFENGRWLRVPSSEAEGDSVWRRVGESKVTVWYRDGKESVNPREWGRTHRIRRGKGW